MAIIETCQRSILGTASLNSADVPLSNKQTNDLVYCTMDAGYFGHVHRMVTAGRTSSCFLVYYYIWPPCDLSAPLIRSYI